MSDGRIEVPLGRPPLRVWDIDSNSTRYDKLVAAPSDDTLRLMWILWAIIFGLIALYVAVIFFAILINRKCRKSPFNCYLLFLMVPDLTYTTLCSISCWMNVAAGHYYSPSACRWQSWYIIWGVGANGWLNAVVSYEIRKMLRASYIRQRYFPPTRKRVVIQSLAVYLYVGFVSLWGVVGLGWLPHETKAQTGLVCVPVEFDLASSLFFWLLFVPAFIGIPLVYIGYVVWDILYHKLLPPVGKRRMIGVYFFRIAVVFVVMWTPTIICFYILNGLDPWAVWASSVWGHLQGFVSSTVSLMKPDIYRAVRDFVSCRIWFHNPDGTIDEKYSYSENSTGSLRRYLGRRFSSQRSMRSVESSIPVFPPEVRISDASEVTRDSCRTSVVSTREDDEYTDVPLQCESSYQFVDEIPDDDNAEAPLPDVEEGDDEDVSITSQISKEESGRTPSPSSSCE